MNQRVRSHALPPVCCPVLLQALDHVFGPPQRFLLWPGSNSQVGLKTLNRLITRLDEVPPLLVAHDSHRMHPWCYLYKRVRRSLSSDRIILKSLRLRRWCSPQGLRRPRFSFFYSVFKQPGAEAPHPLGNFRFRNLHAHPTTIGNRRLVGC